MPAPLHTPGSTLDDVNFASEQQHLTNRSNDPTIRRAQALVATVAGEVAEAGGAAEAAAIMAATLGPDGHLRLP
jgi:hypothetical protein